MPRIIKHPVMGWFVIMLLATIVAIPPVFLWVSPAAAQWVSLVGTLITINFGMGAVLWDYFIVRKRRL